VRLANRATGIYHFLFDRAPRHIPEVSPKPRRQSSRTEDGIPVDSKIFTGNDIQQSINQAIEESGPLTAVVSRGNHVMIKPNFNSNDPPPASTDLSFLKAVIEILFEENQNEWVRIKINGDYLIEA